MWGAVRIRCAPRPQDPTHLAQELQRFGDVLQDLEAEGRVDDCRCETAEQSAAEDLDRPLRVEGTRVVEPVILRHAGVEDRAERLSPQPTSRIRPWARWATTRRAGDRCARRASSWTGVRTGHSCQRPLHARLLLGSTASSRVGGQHLSHRRYHVLDVRVRQLGREGDRDRPVGDELGVREVSPGESEGLAVVGMEVHGGVVDADADVLGLQSGEDLIPRSPSGCPCRRGACRDGRRAVSPGAGGRGRLAGRPAKASL